MTLLRSRLAFGLLDAGYLAAHLLLVSGFLGFIEHAKWSWEVVLCLGV